MHCEDEELRPVARGPLRTHLWQKRPEEGRVDQDNIQALIELWGCFVLVCAVMLALYVWIRRSEYRIHARDERWLENKLGDTDWRLQPGRRRIEELGLPPDCLGEYPGWAEARMLAICRSGVRTAWIFRLRTQEWAVPVRVLSELNELAAFVMQSSQYHFPHLRIRNKALFGWWAGRSSPEVTARFPELSRRWAIRTEDEGQEALAILCDLEEVLKRAKEFRSVELRADHLTIVGQLVGGRDGFTRFARQVRDLLESLGESDPFAGAFGATQPHYRFR